MEDKYLYMIRQAQEFMNENHYADISRLHCLLRKMMPKEYHDLIDQIKECQDPHVIFNIHGGNNLIAPNASRPISKIVGEFKIEKILCDTPEKIWKETRHQSGVTRKFFDKYYKGREKAVALMIKDCKEYKEAINPESLIPNFKVPQSFIYIEDKITPQTA